MTSVTLDRDTLDHIGIAALRCWRAEVEADQPTHPEDIAAKTMRLAAIDILLGWHGAKP